MQNQVDTWGDDLEQVRERRALVIGGGIAGSQAALDPTEARTSVTLVRKGSLSPGRMAQLDTTFLTMDCPE